MSFEIEAGVLIAYHGNDTTVTVPPEVIEIQAQKFHDWRNVKTLVLTNPNVEIDDVAFANCCDLEDVYFPIGTMIFEDHFPPEIFRKIRFHLCLSDKESVEVPHQFILSYIDWEDLNDPASFEYSVEAMLADFDKIKNPKDKLAFAKSVVENTSLPGKEKCINFLAGSDRVTAGIDTTKRKRLINAVVKGDIQTLHKLVKTIDCEFELEEVDDQIIVLRMVCNQEYWFTNILRLPFFKYSQIKCVLWIEETENDGDNIAVYKDYGSKSEYSFHEICDARTFYMEDIEFSQPYLDEDFSFDYTDYSDGMEYSVEYTFENRDAWEDDSCFDVDF